MDKRRARAGVWQEDPFDVLPLTMCQAVHAELGSASEGQRQGLRWSRVGAWSWTEAQRHSDLHTEKWAPAAQGTGDQGREGKGLKRAERIGSSGHACGCAVWGVAPCLAGSTGAGPPARFLGV